jgi:hypothetical protein
MKYTTHNIVEVDGKKCRVVDIEEINADEDCRFYVDGQFLKEKNDNKATDMPIHIALFNKFWLVQPINNPKKKVEFARRFKRYKQNNGSPNYDDKSAKRIMTEMVGFFRSCPVLKVEVAVLHRNKIDGKPILIRSKENYFKDPINWEGREVWLTKKEHFWLKDAKQTSILDV